MSSSQASFLDNFAGGEAPAAPAQPAPDSAPTGETPAAAPAQPAAPLPAPDKQAEPDDYDPEDIAEKTPEARAGLRKRLAAEADRRRKAEAELEVLRRMSGQQNPKVAEPTQPVDETDEFYANPTGFVRKTVDSVRGEVAKMRWEVSREMVAASNKDYDEAEKAFHDSYVATNDQLMLAELTRQANPAKFVYEHGKRQLAMQKTGATSLDELTEKIRAEEREKILKELKADAGKAAVTKAAPTSAGAAGSGAPTETRVSMDDLDFRSILKGVANQY